MLASFSTTVSIGALFSAHLARVRVRARVRARARVRVR